MMDMITVSQSNIKLPVLALCFAFIWLKFEMQKCNSDHDTDSEAGAGLARADQGLLSDPKPALAFPLGALPPLCGVRLAVPQQSANHKCSPYRYICFLADPSVCRTADFTCAANNVQSYAPVHHGPKKGKACLVVKSLHPFVPKPYVLLSGQW